MTDYDAVVYDLDGTLVRLAVDWDRVATEVADILAEAGVADADERSLWSMLDLASEVGVRDEVESTIATHERDGARKSRRLAGADDLVAWDGPAAVCSLNAAAACHVALETHDLTKYVDAVVGRDSLGARKPDPAPLLAALEPLDVEPARALFVGDSERDATAAERAGLDFQWADER